MSNLSESVRAALDGWYANEARGQTLDAWLEERLGPVGAVVTDVVREVDATHGEVTQASDRYRWLAGRIAGLRGRVGDDTVGLLLGNETEASLAHAAIDGAAGALQAIQGELLPALDPRDLPSYASSLADFFERPNGHARDVDVVRVVSIPVIERLGGPAAPRPLVGVTVAGLDAGIRLVKAAVRVGLDRDALGDAVEWAVDRAAAAAAVAVEKAAEEGGAKLGAAVGGWVGAFVGAAHVGAALGAQVGRMAGARVGSAIASGVRAVAKEVASVARSAVDWGVQKVTGFFAGIFG
jgi:hypothetical protein